MGPTVGVAIAAVLLGGMGWMVRWNYKHPCVAYQAVYVEAWTEIQYSHLDCGRECSIAIPIPIQHPAHWEQRCTATGDRDRGDVEASPAPIPAERPW